MLDAPTHAHIPYRFGTNLCTRVIKEGKTIWEREPF